LFPPFALWNHLGTGALPTENALLEGIEGVVCMMDDILVYGKNQEEHDE